MLQIVGVLIVLSLIDVGCLWLCREVSRRRLLQRELRALYWVENEEWIH